ncbi:hypothetical protein ACS4N0_10085 [Levilactobacillus zymae]|uniref:hypothetical protein n=1 Tax=Levilactobacillus zymae TaxID=267363 RepID=UPI003FCE0346
MSRNYYVGQGLFKRSFEEAFNEAQMGDTLVLDPGEYSYNLKLAGVNLKGNGGSSRDVVIHGLLEPTRNLSLENLSVVTDKSMTKSGENLALTVNRDVQVTCTNCRFDAGHGKSVAIWVGGTGHLTLTHCEAYTAGQTVGLDVVGGQVTCQNSIINGLLVMSKGAIHLAKTRILDCIKATNQSRVTAEDLYLERTFLQAESGSQIRIQHLTVPEGNTALNAYHGLIDVQQTNADDTHRIFKQLDSQATINCPRAMLVKD